VHQNPCTCPACGGELRTLGEDISEMLEYVPSHFKVIRHIRPKLSCASCQKIVQPAAPSRPIERGLAGPGLLAHVLVSKYCDHLPLYRQSQIFAREGIDLGRSTLADWVGGASALLEPLVNAIGKYVLASYKIPTPSCRRWGRLRVSCRRRIFGQTTGVRFEVRQRNQL
jgi:transposase